MVRVPIEIPKGSISLSVRDSNLAFQDSELCTHRAGLFVAA